MILCAAQTKGIKGDIHSNTINHLKFIKKAASLGAELIIFPELSLSGYEPRIIKSFEITSSDIRLLPFYEAAKKFNIHISVGVPLKTEKGITISQIFYHPDKEYEILSKNYLHDDEHPWFVSGTGEPILKINNIRIGFGICYETTKTEHLVRIQRGNTEIYIASVAKSAKGLPGAYKQLAGIAEYNSVPAMLVNCVGENDDFISAGGSAAWNREGEMLGSLDGESEMMLLFDTDTNTAIRHTPD